MSDDHRDSQGRRINYSDERQQRQVSRNSGIHSRHRGIVGDHGDRDFGNGENRHIDYSFGNHRAPDLGQPKPKQKPASDLGFLDKVHEWTFNRHGPNRPLSREVMAVQARLRGKLREAQRFILDDEAVEVTAGLSREFERLEAWSFLARLPYDCMWLQFNLHHKVEALRALDDRMLPLDRENVSPLIGYLLFRDTDGDSPVWIAHEFYQTSEGEPFIGMLAYVFDPEGDPMWPVRGSKYWRSPTLSLRKGFPRLPVFLEMPTKTGEGEESTIPFECPADPEIALCGVFEPKGTPDEDGKVRFDFTIDDDGGHIQNDLVGAPSWFLNRAAVIVDPWWDHYFAPRWRNEEDTKKANDFLMFQINECRGAMKFLITLLAAINGLPRDIRPIVTRSGKRPVGMNMLPYLGHSHLRIELPRDNRVVYARNTLDGNEAVQHRRNHPVIGHWRVVERGKKITHLCRHMPTMVENGLGMCEICEMLIRWIKPHRSGRGEGFVDHEHYEVTGQKRGKRHDALAEGVEIIDGP